jgi:hypothetical protein
VKRSFATISLILFGLSVIFLILWTVSESVFAGMSTFAERIVTFALLVLPAGIGAVLGIMSLSYREGRRWLAITGIVLNTLFALFHLALVLFAG